MEQLAIIIPMFMVPLTLLAIYGVVWPNTGELNTRSYQTESDEAVHVSATAGRDFSYR